MKYLVLDNFKTITKTGGTVIQAGMVIALPEEKAAALIEARKITLLRAIFEDLFHAHMKKLKAMEFPVTEIKTVFPGLWDADTR